MDKFEPIVPAGKEAEDTALWRPLVEDHKLRIAREHTLRADIDKYVSEKLIVGAELKSTLQYFECELEKNKISVEDFWQHSCEYYQTVVAPRTEQLFALMPKQYQRHVDSEISAHNIRIEDLDSDARKCLRSVVILTNSGVTTGADASFVVFEAFKGFEIEAWRVFNSQIVRRERLLRQKARALLKDKNQKKPALSFLIEDMKQFPCIINLPVTGENRFPAAKVWRVIEELNEDPWQPKSLHIELRGTKASALLMLLFGIDYNERNEFLRVNERYNHIDLWNPLELQESLVDICKLSLELILLQNDRNQYIHELVLEPEDSGDLARLKHIVNRVLESIAQVQSLQFE